jgi:hypothetical protein
MTEARAKNEKVRAIINWLAPRRARVRLLRIVLRQKTKDPHRALKRLERGSANATLWIFLGIVVETGGVIWFARNWTEAFIAITGNALIGYGLILEYVLILRAIVASGAADREAALKVAEANSRAAKANAIAARAVLELEELKKPRRIDFNNFKQIMDDPRALRGKIEILYVRDCPDCAILSAYILKPPLWGRAGR